MAVELKFSRVDRVYRPPDVVEGTVLIITPTSITHQGVRLIATGTIMLQLSARQVGVFEALYSSVKPIQLMNKTVDISPAGKISPGKTEVSFSIFVLNVCLNWFRLRHHRWERFLLLLTQESRTVATGFGPLLLYGVRRYWDS
jgi:hypothetical protein